MQSLEQVESDANSAQSLQQFINDSKARLRAILEQLQWTEADVEKCFNTNSAAAQAASKAHNATVDEEPELPMSCATSNSVTLAQSELQALLNDANAQIPKKFSDLQLNFTRAQKLQIYEHVLAHTEKRAEPEATVPALGADNLTFAEIVAQKKREKKKKRRYRRSKPTHIEEVRAVVELQMQALQQYLGVKVGEESEEKCTVKAKHKYDTSKDSSRDGEHVARAKHWSLRNRSPSAERKRENKIRCRSRSWSYDKKRGYSRNRQKHKHRSHSVSRSKRKHKHHSRSTSRSDRKHSRYYHSEEKRSRHSRSVSRSNRKHRHRSRSASRSDKHSRHSGSGKQHSRRSRSDSRSRKKHASRSEQRHSISRDNSYKQHQVRSDTAAHADRDHKRKLATDTHNSHYSKAEKYIKDINNTEES